MALGTLKSDPGLGKEAVKACQVWFMDPSFLHPSCVANRWLHLKFMLASFPFRCQNAPHWPGDLEE